MWLLLRAQGIYSLRQPGDEGEGGDLVGRTVTQFPADAEGACPLFDGGAKARLFDVEELGGYADGDVQRVSVSQLAESGQPVGNGG